MTRHCVGLQRERIRVFWRRVLHNGPSGEVKWDEADPTYSVKAAKRGVADHAPIRPLAYFTAPGNRTSFSNEQIAFSASFSP